jgi:hypothetical protein
VTAQFELVRQPPYEIDESNVEERRPDFEPVHHAGTIRFHQDVVFEIKSRKELQRAVDRRGRAGRIPEFNRFAVEFLQ